MSFLIRCGGCGNEVNTNIVKDGESNGSLSDDNKKRYLKYGTRP